MADRLFLFDDDTDTDTDAGFQFTGQRTVGAEDYTSSFVNFYNTALGLPELATETGIDVDVDEDITELADPTARPEKDDDDSGADLRQILEQPLLGAEGQTTEASTVSFYGSGVPSGDVSFNSYSDYLKSSKDGKFSDRVGLVQNIYEPGVTGNFKDIDLGAGFKSEVTATKEKVKDAPSRMERLLKGELTDEDSKKLAGGMMALAGGPVGSVAGTFVGGSTVTNAFGNPSFRPVGALGAVADLVHSKQYADMAAIRAAVSATDITQLAKTDTGFAISIGNMGITRAPGSGTYTGNTRGMNIEQLLALEAVGSGYDPTRGRYNALNPSKNQTVVESGGMFITDNPMQGFYRANGTFYDPRTGASAAYGRKSDAQKAADTAGISYDEFQNALDTARDGTTTLAQAIQGIKSAKAAEVARQQREEKDKAAAAAAAAEQRRIRENKRILAYSQYYYDDGNDDDRGPSLSSSGPSGPQESAFDNVDDIEGLDPDDYALGGRVGLAMGGAAGAAASGFVDRPPEQVSDEQSVADNRPTQLPEGAFVINAAAVEFAGSLDIKKMILEAEKQAQKQGMGVDNTKKSAKLVDVAVSSGEVVVSPHIAKIIGYDRLTKINNRGRPETRRRIQESGQEPQGAATGGFLLGLRKAPVSDSQGFIPQPQEMPETPIPSRDEDVFFDYKFGDIKGAIKDVEIKGFEKNPYIFTGIKRKGAASSAFGPMQITASTLKDLKQRSGEYDMLSEEAKDYVDALIQQGDDKVNVELYGGIYRNDKKQTVKSDTKKKLGRYGTGTVSKEMHEEFYDVIGDMVLRQKLMDHDTLSQALSSYGEGSGYAQKVMKGLQ